MLLIAGGLAVLVAAAGIGWWLWPDSTTPSASPSSKPVPGTVQAMIVATDQVSSLVGTTLVTGPNAERPPAALTANPNSCAIAVGPTTRSVYTRGWTTFLSTTDQDPGGRAEHTVTQVVGRYADSGKAGEVFQNLTSGIKACPKAVRKDSANRLSGWIYSVDESTQDSLVWTAAQDSADGWTCYHQARLKGKSVLQVTVCEAGDGTKAAGDVMDRFSARVGD